MKHIDVYFRDARDQGRMTPDEAVSYPFCTTTAEEIDKVIPLINGWGFYSDSPDLFGQFVVINDRLVFEVVASDGDG